MTLYMKADIRDQWIEELRSGNYDQGGGDLHAIIPKGFDVYDEKFCCLGVLCLMAKRAGVVQDERVLAGRAVAYGASGETAYLPEEVIEWAGLKYEGKRQYTESDIEEPRGFLTQGTRENAWRDSESLSGMNDSGVPFDEIADVIQTKVIPV